MAVSSCVDVLTRLPPAELPKNPMLTRHVPMIRANMTAYSTVENAVEAIRRAGMEPVRGSIRGGTDGSRLSFMGLPCPNIFAGGHAFHSPLEFVSSQDMEKAVTTIVELVRLWEAHA